MRELFDLDLAELKALGIVDWGYTTESIPHSLKNFESWISQDLQGSLTYLSDYRKDLRSDVRNVYPEFKSGLVFLFNYIQAKKWLLDNQKFEVAAYTLGFEGHDYHYVLKDRLERVFTRLKSTHPGLERFVALDTQPILERDLALRAGLGWFGKNSMLINQKEGSYFIIGTLLLNQELSLNSGQIDVDHCGQCNLCAENCPTNAIDPVSRTLIADKCISTYTIETFKDAPAPEGFEKSRGEFFGCDICQDVCPWNRKPLARVIGSLKLPESLSFIKEWFFKIPRHELLQIISNESNRSFKKKLIGTAFDRPGKQGWLKNLKARLLGPLKIIF